MLASLFYKSINIWNNNLSLSSEREGDIEIEDDEVNENSQTGEKTPDLDEDIFKDGEDDFSFVECF